MTSLPKRTATGFLLTDCGQEESRRGMPSWSLVKRVAPFDKLREWFSHDPKKWEGFKSKYKDELKEKTEFIKEIKKIEKEKRPLRFSTLQKISNTTM